MDDIPAYCNFTPPIETTIQDDGPSQEEAFLLSAIDALAEIVGKPKANIIAASLAIEGLCKLWNDPTTKPGVNTEVAEVWRLQGNLSWLRMVVSGPDACPPDHRAASRTSKPSGHLTLVTGEAS